MSINLFLSGCMGGFIVLNMMNCFKTFMEGLMIQFMFSTVNALVFCSLSYFELRRCGGPNSTPLMTNSHLSKAVDILNCIFHYFVWTKLQKFL